MNSLYIIFFWLSSFSFKTCYGTDTITLTQPLKDPQTLVSSNGTFKLGFFSPSNSSFRYLGICYNQPSVLDFVWVANRNTPLNDTSGVLRVSEDGNLFLLNGQNQVFWSSNVSNGSTKFSVARILDSGNLVLLGFNSMDVGAQVTTTLWQSFEHPTDAALPIMKLPVTQNSDVKKVLWSWKSPSDPAYGRFSMGTESSSLPQLVIYDGDRLYWRSGPWNGNIFIGIQYNISNFVGAGFILENDRQGTGSLTYSYSNASLISNYVLTYQGLLVQQWWDKTKGKWEVLWQAPETECDVYGKCGVFGCCNTLKTPICRCMKGFEPKNKEEWSKGNWTSGCKRRKELKLCGSESGQEDGFFRLSMIKVPDKAEWLEGLDEDECRNQCLKNCSCLAYVYDTGAGCMSWSKDIVDTEEFSNDGVDLYLRLAHSEFGNNSKMIKITTSGLSAVVIAAICVCFTWRLIAQRKGKKIQRKKRTLSEVIRDNEGRVEIKELPLFEYEKLVIATNNFHESNKLGRGGFGPVYKGRLERGQEIAVKRLSKASGQGNEEFMNEVMVISKLQHRNLVRLLGCCVEAQEKMLIYEYLPNKSLDDFLSDPLKRELLTWPKRFKIIKGICRGLLYLHRDSRLRIIHRDIKAGNILLDDDLNPKISDFGMARIFGGNQDQADTRRVVGTYGYMSPEYAMEGRFSEKSDVYSFGVLMLEIVSGKKNSIFWHDEQSLSLLGYVWKQWNEDDMDPVIDPVINESSFKTEIKKCIQVGLLCVQEFAKQRPTISTVISMLTSDVFDLPRPRKPAFTQRQRQVSESSSLNYVSFTELSAR